MFLVPAELGAGPGDGNFCKEHQGCAVFLARINLFALIFVPRAGYLSHFFFFFNGQAAFIDLGRMALHVFKEYR